MKHQGKTIDKVKKYKVIACETCEFNHIYPLPSENELKKIYMDDYYEEEKPKYIKYNLEDQKWWETVYKDRIDFLEKNIKSANKKLLEIGSGPGLFLKYAKSKAWKVTGIEPSKQAAEFSKKNNIPIIQKFYEEVSIKDLGQFDTVCMFEFLEHTPDPKYVIKLAYSLLRKDGIICIGVPNDYNPLQEIARKHLKLKPYWLAPPHHINYFTIDSLSRLLQKNGFEIVHKETNFPLEMFLLMGDNYIGNDTIGRLIHCRRKVFDLSLSKINNRFKKQLYKQFSVLNIGRDITIYARKL